MRQTEWMEPQPPHGTKIHGQDHFRLDPFAESFQFKTALDKSRFRELVDISFNEEWKISGTLHCGIAAKLTCKTTSFRAIAARLSLSPHDEVLAELVLLNRDSALNIPVARHDTMEELAADWQMWANRFNLPLVLIELDGTEQMISNRLGGVSLAPATPRRANTQFVLRRPRFLKNRKTGAFPINKKIEGREIFARAR